MKVILMASVPSGAHRGNGSPEPRCVYSFCGDVCSEVNDVRRRR